MSGNASGQSEFGKQGLMIVAAGIVCTISGPALVGFYTFTLFMSSLEQEFGWGRAELSFAISVGTLSVAASSPPIGKLIDRYGPRIVVSLGILCSAITLTSLYWIGSSLIGIYLAFAMVGVACSAYFVGLPRMISRAFRRQQGMAIGLVMSGTGLGTFILIPVAERLIAEIGWRPTYPVLGVLVLATLVPFLFLSRAYLAHEAGTAAAEGHRATAAIPIRPLLASRGFFLMAACFFLCGIALHGFVVHFVPVFLSLGVSSSVAAMAFGVSGLAIMAGRLGCGILSDRFPANVVGAIAIGLAGGGLLLLSFAPPAMAVVFICAVFFGLGIGAEMDILTIVTSRIFPDAAFARVFAAEYSVFMIGTSIGPFLMGAAFDRYESYAAAVVAAGAATCLAALCLYFVGERRYDLCSADNHSSRHDG